MFSARETLRGAVQGLGGGKNWKLSNRFTKIHLEGAAEGRALGTVFLQRKNLSMLKAFKTLI